MPYLLWSSILVLWKSPRQKCQRSQRRVKRARKGPGMERSGESAAWMAEVRMMVVRARRHKEERFWRVK